MMAEAAVAFPYAHQFSLSQPCDSPISLFNPYNVDAMETDNAILGLNHFLTSLTQDDVLALKSTKSLRSYSRNSSEQKVSDQRLGACCPNCETAGVPLLQAVVADHARCIKDIMKTHPGTNLRAVYSQHGYTLAHVAADHNCLSSLQTLVELEPAIVAVVDRKGATPLHIATSSGSTNCLRYLLRKKCSATSKDYNGATSVHYAAASGHLDCLKVLVGDDKDRANCITNSGETPLYFAAQEGHYHCAQWLVDHAKADPQLATYDGMTPLHAAAGTGQLAMTRWLLKSGNCSIACRTSDGATPVHFAAKRGHALILEWMLQHKIATGLERDDYGATPIHDAAEHGQLECLHVFYNHSITLKMQDADGLTPKDLAIEKNQHKCVAFFKNPQQQMRVWAKQQREAHMLWRGRSGTQTLPEGAELGLKKRRTLSFFQRMKANVSSKQNPYTEILK